MRFKFSRPRRNLLGFRPSLLSDLQAATAPLLGAQVTQAPWGWRAVVDYYFRRLCYTHLETHVVVILWAYWAIVRSKLIKLTPTIHESGSLGWLQGVSSIGSHPKPSPPHLSFEGDIFCHPQMQKSWDTWNLSPNRLLAASTLEATDIFRKQTLGWTVLLPFYHTTSEVPKNWKVNEVWNVLNLFL